MHGTKSLYRMHGTKSLYRMHEKKTDYLASRDNAKPIVVDAADLQAHPDETMKSYCEAVGINYEPSMTTWKPLSAASELGARERPYWYDAALQSSGFKKTDPRDQKPVPLDQLPKDFVDYIDKCRPLYEEMRAGNLSPQQN